MAEHNCEKCVIMVAGLNITMYSTQQISNAQKCHHHSKESDCTKQQKTSLAGKTR